MYCAVAISIFSRYISGNDFEDLIVTLLLLLDQTPVHENLLDNESNAEELNFRLSCLLFKEKY